MSVHLISLLIIVVVFSTDADVIHRTEDNQMGLKRPIIIAFYKFHSKLNTKINNYLKKRLQTLSDVHKDVVFAVSDSDQYMSALHEYGFEFDWKSRLESEPIVMAEDVEEYRYVFHQKLEFNSLQKFVQQFKDKALNPHLKSEPIPDNNGKVVKEMVGKTFNQLVFDNPKNLMILMYAQWCGHCTQVLQIWQRLGERLANHPNVDILQMDVTKNWSPKPFNTMSYPTIYWVPIDGKHSPQKYSGERDVKSFVEFIDEMLKKQKQNIKSDINLHKTEL